MESKKLRDYQRNLESLYNLHHEVSASYSLKNFEEDHILKLIVDLRVQGGTPTPKHFENIVADILEKELIEFEVLNEVFGATLGVAKIYFGES